MNGGEKASGNRVLVGVLACLCVAIVGLTVGIVVMNLNQSGESDESGELYDCTPGPVDPDQFSKEEEASSIEFQEYFNALTNSVNELFSTEPVDLNAIIALYDSGMQKYIEKNDYRKVALIVGTRTGQLISRGYDQTALDLLESVDFSKFNKVEQYRQYTQVIEIAEKLGRSDVVEKYKTLISGVQEAYEQSEAARIKVLEEQEKFAEYCKGREG